MSHCSRRLDYITMVTQVDVNYHRSDSHHISIVLSAAASIAQMHSLLFADQISLFHCLFTWLPTLELRASHGQHGSSQRTVMFESVACKFDSLFNSYSCEEKKSFCSVHCRWMAIHFPNCLFIRCPSPGASCMPWIICWSCFDLAFCFILLMLASFHDHSVFNKSNCLCCSHSVIWCWSS